MSNTGPLSLLALIDAHIDEAIDRIEARGEPVTVDAVAAEVVLSQDEWDYLAVQGLEVHSLLSAQNPN